MRTRTLFFAGMVALMPIGQLYADANSSSADDGARLSMKEKVTKWMLSDEKFVEKAAMGGRAEIEMSKLAIEKSQSPEVRDFAKQMVKDHTTAATELAGIAQSKNLAVPGELDHQHREAISDLKALNGAEFDAKYIDIMQKDHDKTVSLFTAAAADEKLDKQLQQFAEKTLPVIRGHAGHAQALENKKVGSR
jgi:putative membrane protein